MSLLSMTFKSSKYQFLDHEIFFQNFDLHLEATSLNFQKIKSYSLSATPNPPPPLPLPITEFHLISIIFQIFGSHLGSAPFLILDNTHRIRNRQSRKHLD